MAKKANKIPRSSVVGAAHIQHNREVSISGGNYSEKTGDDCIQGNKTDRARNIEITGVTVNASGAGAFALGDISGTIANTINQLPTSPDPGKPEIKELLTQLEEAITYW